MSCVLGNMNEQHSCVNEAIRTRGRAVFGFGIDIRFRA